MSDELLSFYEKELAFLRQSGAEFAKAHPKIAGRLRISDDVVEDPHVSRLLEGVAYMNARIQTKLDDDFPGSFIRSGRSSVRRSNIDALSNCPFFG